MKEQIKEKEIFSDDIIKEIEDLEKEYIEIKKEMEEYHSPLYDEENWNRKIVIIKRIKILKTLI